jgi:hypothetical protein
MGAWMNFKGTVSVRGDSGDPLPVECEVTDTHLMVTSRDGSVIGSWSIDELSVSQTADGVVLRVDGETLTFTMRKSAAFVNALGAAGTSNVAGRISKARKPPTDSDRVRPLLAVGLIAGLVAVAGIGLWVAGMPPFDRSPSETITVVSRTRTTAPPQPTRTTSPPQPNFTKATIVTSTTKALSTLEEARSFWIIHLAGWQGTDTGDGGNVLGYLDRAIDASHRGDWGEMGAECIAAQPIAEMAKRTFFLTAPTTEIEQLEKAFWDEILDALYWCATGTDTAANMYNPPLDVAMALQDRISDALRDLGLIIRSE